MDGCWLSVAAPRACPQPGRWKGRAALAGASLAFVLGAAHFFRSGQHGLACVCLVWAGLLWRPVAWLRRSAAVFLLGLAAEWGMTTLALARWRLQLGQDWRRMGCILGAVAALTLLAAAALRSRACRRDEVSGPRAQALACLQVSALLLLVGAVYLLWRKVITWHIPVAVLGTMAVFVFLVGLGQGMHGEAMWEFPLFHLLAGGAILGAVSMATDYSTSPMTHTGMLIYGVGIGIITVLIRLWGAYPEGMSFANLIMNSVVPLINKYVKPRRFGLK